MIEVVLDNGESGVYFVKPGTSVNQTFSQLGFSRKITEDMQLQNGMKIRLVPEEDHRGIVVEKVDAAKRLALGLLLDINLVDWDELKLIPGVGDVLAANIVAEREKIGRFDKLDQLMNIKGIKGKKLSKLRQYLYVDKLAQ
jgi:competence protein ComEA